VFTRRIVRSKVNWQVTRELADRAIVQHEDTSSNARFSALPAQWRPARQLRRQSVDGGPCRLQHQRALAGRELGSDPSGRAAIVGQSLVSVSAEIDEPGPE
jgi:hypothetical protein